MASPMAHLCAADGSADDDDLVGGGRLREAHLAEATVGGGSSAPSGAAGASASSAAACVFKIFVEWSDDPMFLVGHVMMKSEDRGCVRAFGALAVVARGVSCPVMEHVKRAIQERDFDPEDYVAGYFSCGWAAAAMVVRHIAPERAPADVIGEDRVNLTVAHMVRAAARIEREYGVDIRVAAGHGGDEIYLHGDASAGPSFFLDVAGRHWTLRYLELAGRRVLPFAPQSLLGWVGRGKRARGGRVDITMARQ